MTTATMESVLDRIPDLVCATCKGELRAQGEETLTCRTCGETFQLAGGLPRMLTGDLIDFAREIDVQDRVAVQYEAKRYQDPYARRYHEWWTRKMLAHVPEQGLVLDNGCGIGVLADHLPIERVVGLDISGQMLQRAATRTDRLVLGNSQDLPFRDGAFRTAFCRSLLHHLPDGQAAVREMHRVLQPGGQLVLVDTNASLLSSLPRWIKYRTEAFSEEHKNLNQRALRRILDPWFHVDRVEYFGYVAYPMVAFPDQINVFRFFPLKNLAYGALMGLDAILSHIPLVRTQSWAILITASRRDTNA